MSCLQREEQIPIPGQGAHVRGCEGGLQSADGRVEEDAEGHDVADEVRVDTGQRSRHDHHTLPDRFISGDVLRVPGQKTFCGRPHYVSQSAGQHLHLLEPACSMKHSCRVIQCMDQAACTG